MEFLEQLTEPLTHVPNIDVRNFPIVSQHWPEVTAVFAPLYLVLVFFGPRIMSRFQAFDLKWPMALWNLSLSLLSVGMFFGIAVPTIKFSLATPRFWHHLVTLNAEWDQPTWVGSHIFWMWLFGLSKIIELGDTVFLVLRKREIPFLHWYHHTTVLGFTWFAMWCLAGPGFMFAIMNSFVHIIMYFYYFLTGLGFRPFFGKYITQLQMLQMVMGVTCVASWAYYTLTEGTVMFKPHPYWFMATATVMYASYFYLFLQFYIGRYNANNARKAATAAAAANNAKKAQ